MKSKRRELGINIVSGLGYARFQENWPGSILPRRGAHPARPRVSPFKRAPYVIRKEEEGGGGSTLKNKPVNKTCRAITRGVNS